MNFHQVKQKIEKWQPNPALRVVEFLVLGGIVLAFLMPLVYYVFPGENTPETPENSAYVRIFSFDKILGSPVYNSPHFKS